MTVRRVMTLESRARFLEPKPGEIFPFHQMSQRDYFEFEPSERALVKLEAKKYNAWCRKFGICRRVAIFTKDLHIVVILYDPRAGAINHALEKESSEGD